MVDNRIDDDGRVSGFSKVGIYAMPRKKHSHDHMSMRRDLHLFRDMSISHIVHAARQWIPIFESVRVKAYREMEVGRTLESTGALCLFWYIFDCDIICILFPKQSKVSTSPNLEIHFASPQTDKDGQKGSTDHVFCGRWQYHTVL